MDRVYYGVCMVCESPARLDRREPFGVCSGCFRNWDEDPAAAGKAVIGTVVFIGGLVTFGVGVVLFLSAVWGR